MSLTPRKRAAYMQVCSEMLSHSDRCQYLRSHGFIVHQERWLAGIGPVALVEKGDWSAWLDVTAGDLRIHGRGGDDLKWPQVVEWLNPKPKEPEKPKAKQRSMFDE